MEVVGVVTVAAGAEHRVELGTGAGERLLQKGPLARAPAPPPLQHLDLAAIGQAEGGNVQRIAEGMLGNLGAGNAVAGAAVIGGDLPDRDHGLAEMGIGRPLHRGSEPAIERHRHRAVDGGWRLDGNRAVEGAGYAERVLEPAGRGAIDDRQGPHIGRGAKLSVSQARRLDVAAPGRPPFRLERSKRATDKTDGGRQQSGQIRDPGPHDR